MEFQELLKKRRAIRDFQDKKVPLEVVKAVIQDSCLAPTASNGQPCKFIIVQDKKMIKKLSDESKKNLLADCELDPQSPLNNYKAVLAEESFNAFYNAPCLVFVVGPKQIWSLDIDCSLTVSYLMLSAADKGLGTCWIALGANIRDKKTLDEIGVPDDCRIVAPIILGYPANIPEASERHAPEILKVL
jgi:nitroreductase